MLLLVFDVVYPMALYSQEVDDKLMNLEKKEKDLLIREEKLAARESVSACCYYPKVLL